MKNDEKPEPRDVIQNLVAEEEEAAFRRFRDHDFSARVKARVCAEEKVCRLPPFGKKSPSRHGRAPPYSFLWSRSRLSWVYLVDPGKRRYKLSKTSCGKHLGCRCC